MTRASLLVGRSLPAPAPPAVAPPAAPLRPPAPSLLVGSEPAKAELAAVQIVVPEVPAPSAPADLDQVSTIAAEERPVVSDRGLAPRPGPVAPPAPPATRSGRAARAAVVAAAAAAAVVVVRRRRSLRRRAGRTAS